MDIPPCFPFVVGVVANTQSITPMVFDHAQVDSPPDHPQIFPGLRLDGAPFLLGQQRLRQGVRSVGWSPPAGNRRLPLETGVGYQ